MDKLNIKNWVLWGNAIQRDGNKLHEKKQGQDQAKDQAQEKEFEIIPGEHIIVQMARFRTRYKQGLWDQELQIKNYLGTFKIEYWIYAEQQLREIDGLAKISFINTKINKKHLKILFQLLLWIRPDDVQIKFKANELDDDDMDEFTMDLLDKEIKFSQLIIISNPGIFKGHFLSRLQRKLDLMKDSFTTFQYILEINYDFCSMALFKTSLEIMDEDQEMIEDIKRVIQETLYYDLNLSKCFTEKNYQGFQYLIEQCYHEDNLEQLQSLNLKDNYLGSSSEFLIQCENISLAKGMLNLGLSKQPNMEYGYIMQALTGDRYDKLRLNKIDLSENNKMLEKTWKIFVEGIMTSCKEVNITGTLPQELSTLNKFLVWIEQGQREIKKLKEISNQQNIIAKLPLKALDLSKLENYNRHDLVEMFLQVYVYNEHSSLQTFIIQNCDDGRKKTYIKAKKQFVEYIISKQSEKLYQNFKPTLGEIHIANQTYKQTQEILIEMMYEVVFTNEKDLFNIHTVKFLDGSFKISGFDDGMKQFFTQLAQKGKDDPKGPKLSIKTLELKNTTIYDHECLVDAFLTNPLVELKEFSVIKDQLHSQVFEKIHNYVEVTLVDQLYSLKTLTLVDIEDTSFSLPEILKTCVYNPKIRLINLKLANFALKEDQEKLDEFVETYKKKSFFLSSIENFSFGQFDGGHHLWDFINYTIMDINFKPKKLEILQQNFSEYFNKYVEKQKANLDLQKNPLDNLQELKIQKLSVQNIKIDGIDYKQSEQWEWIAGNFIFRKNMKCELFELDGVDLNEDIYDGFLAAIEKAHKDLAIQYDWHEIDEQQQKIQSDEHDKKIDQILLNTKITTLSLKNCSFKHEFLSLFFMSIFCKICDLTIENCQGLEESLKMSKQFDETQNKDKIYSFALKKVNLKGTPINDVPIFQWFFSNVAFNTNRQILEYLNLQSCNINDAKLDVLSKCVDTLLKNSQQQGFKRYYKIRELNLEDNKDISANAWKKFIDIILTTSHMEKNDERLNQQKEINEKRDDESRQEHDVLLHKGSDDIHIDMTVQGFEKCDQNERFKYFTNYLNIHEKILMQKDLFKFQAPFKLQEVSLNMSFNDECRADCYYKSIKGLILFPGTNVNRLILKSLDLNEFITQFKKSHRELEQMLYRQFSLKLQHFEITSLTSQSDESTKLLVENIIKSSISTLTSLSLAGFDNKNIIKEIVDLKEDNQIETMIFKDINEKLDQETSKNFIEKLILGKYFCIKKLNICKGIKLEKLDDPHFVLDVNYQYPLKDLVITIDNAELDSGWLKQCAAMIIGGQFIKLKNLYIGSTNDPQILTEVVDLQRFTIDELSIEHPLNWSQQYQDFFQQARRTLETLKLNQLKITGDIQIDEDQDFFPLQPNLKLHLKIIESESYKQQYLDKIVFGKFFKVDWIKLIDEKTITSLQKITSVNFQNLKYLMLNPGLLYNSSVQIGEAALKLIGQKLIYNEDSQLEFIGLASCHLKPAGVKALVSGADAFRNQIKEQGKESTCYLKLKTFDIYYSLYLLDEGFQFLIKDIIFFEYITLTRLLNEVTNFNNEQVEMLCDYGQKWLKFQNENNRKHKIYQFTYFSIARNEFVKLEPVWKKLVQNFLFSDLCPFVETLCMHFMGIDDQIGSYVTKYVLEFLNKKPSNYVHNVKRLQFSLNKDFTPVGWENISRNLLFHKKVDYVELHLSSCMLDSLEKLDAVCNPAIEKALARPNKKLALHSLNTFNLTNKDKLVNYLSPRPIDYKFDTTYYVEPHDAYQYGILDGFQEQFGTIVRVIQKIVHTVDKLRKDNEWKNQSRHRWVTFHLSFAQSYIKVINDECVKKYGAKSFDLYFSYASLDQLAKIFIYDRQSNGEPYPSNLLFQEEFYQYIRQQQCILKKIYILPEFRGENDKLTQFHIYEYWKRIKNRSTSIDQVIIDYTANDDLFEKMIADGYTERDILQLLRIFPPSKIRTQDQMTISFIKGVFTVLWDVDHFNYSTVTFDQDNILNIGIGYFLRERIFRQNILRQAKYTLYLFLSLFVSDQEIFEFDDQTKDLNVYLSGQRFLFFILSFFIFVLYFFAVFLGYWLTYQYQKDDLNKSGNSLYANISCYCYLFVTAIFELWFYRKLISILPKFDKGMIQVDEISKIELEEEDKFQKQTNQLSSNKVFPDDQVKNFQRKPQKAYKKKRTVIDKTKRSSTFFIAQQKSKKVFTKIQEFLQELTSTNFGKILTVIIKIIMSQLEKLDLFNDIGFIFQCDQNNSNLIFYIAIAITLFNMLNDFISFLFGVYQRIREHATSNKIISTKFINDFYSLAFIGKFAALSEIFDIVAPFNVTVIPNNKLFRYLMPKFAGRSINNNMKNYLFKFLFKFVPQLVLQLLFVIQQALSTTGSLTWSILLTIVVTGVNIFFAFIRFMSIRPPTISNTDFDTLAEKKIKKYDKIQNERYFKELEQLQFYNDLYRIPERKSELNMEQKHDSLSPKNELDQLI